MRTSRTCLAAVLALALCAGAAAQTPPAPPEPPKAPEKASAPAKPKQPAEPKKADAKKKPAAKKAEPKKSTAPAAAPKVYTTGPKELRDKDGNVIPTSPDAYNVDSAMPPKPRK